MLRRLCEVLSRREFSETAIEAMLAAVDDISVEDFEQAVNYLIQHSNHLPSISELREGIISGVFSSSTLQETDDEIDWLALIESEDREEMGLDEDEYIVFKSQWEEDHGEPYIPPGATGLFG